MTSRQPPSQRNRDSVDAAVRHNARNLLSQGGPGFLSGRFATAQPVPGGSWVDLVDDGSNDGPELDDLQFEHAEPAYTPTDAEMAAGVFTRQLLHTEIAAEHGLFTTINGVALGSKWWSLDADAGVVTVLIPNWVANCPPDRREFGWPMYAYRRGLAATAMVTIKGSDGTAASGPVTSLSIPIPASTAGDTILLATGRAAAPAGWTLVADPASGSTDLRIYGRTADGTETSVTVSGSSAYMAGITVVLSGGGLDFTTAVEDPRVDSVFTCPDADAPVLSFAIYDGTGPPPDEHIVSADTTMLTNLNVASGVYGLACATGRATFTSTTGSSGSIWLGVTVGMA